MVEPLQKCYLTLAILLGVVKIIFLHWAPPSPVLAPPVFALLAPYVLLAEVCSEVQPITHPSIPSPHPTIALFSPEFETPHFVQWMFSDPCSQAAEHESLKGCNKRKEVVPLRALTQFLPNLNTPQLLTQFYGSLQKNYSDDKLQIHLYTQGSRKCTNLGTGFGVRQVPWKFWSGHNSLDPSARRAKYVWAKICWRADRQTDRQPILPFICLDSW